MRKSINIPAAIFFALLGLLTTLSANAKTIDKVVGKVNDSIITLSEVEERAVALRGRWQGDPSQTPSDKEFMRNALDMFVEEKLLIQEGENKELTVEEEQVDKAVKGIQTQNNLSDEAMRQMLEHEGVSIERYKEQIRNQIMISQVRKTQFQNRARIGEKALKKYYRSHRKDFTTPTKIHARHIMFILDKKLPESARQLKREKIREVLRKIRSGEDFNKMAKIHSEDISASKGGDLGVLEEGKMLKSFQHAAFKLKDGEVSPVVETPYGLHIIKVDKKIPGKILSLKQAENQIREILFNQGLEKRYKKWIAGLKKKSYVEITLFKNSEKKLRRSSRGIRQTASLSRMPSPAKAKKPSRKSNGKSKRPSVQSLSRDPVKKKTKKAQVKRNDDSKNMSLSAMEKKLIQIKTLKNKKRISESEYQKRKKQLLSQL